MNRRFSDLLVIAGVILLLTAYGAAGWLALPVAERTFLPTFSAVGVVLINCVLLYMLNERLLSGTSLLVAVLYAVLATARPASLVYTPYHTASLLLAVSICAYLHYNAGRPSLKYLVGAWAALGAAVLVTPQLAWLIPVYALSSIGKAEDKVKFWVAAPLALILPVAAWAGICYIRSGEAPGALLSKLWSGMCAVERPSFPYSAASMCRLLLTVVAALLAIVHVARRLDSYKTAQARACMRLMILTLSLSVLTLLFFSHPAIPSGLLTVLPVAPLLGEYFSHAVRGKGVGTLAIVLILLLIAERVSYFV